MFKYDRWLLERVFEPLACEIESWAGANHWRVARFMIVVWTASNATWAIDKHKPWAYAILGVELLVATIIALASIVFERLDGRLTGTANFLKHDWTQAFNRITQIVLTVLTAFTSGLLLIVGSAALAAMWYFAACDRLPPKERRVLQMPMLEPRR